MYIPLVKACSALVLLQLQRDSIFSQYFSFWKPISASLGCLFFIHFLNKLFNGLKMNPHQTGFFARLLHEVCLFLFQNIRPEKCGGGGAAAAVNLPGCFTSLLSRLKCCRSKSLVVGSWCPESFFS